MRKWLPLLGLILFGSASHAQIFTLIDEDFDTPPLPAGWTIETVHNLSGTVTSGGWNDTTFLAVSSPNSMHAQRTSGYNKYIETPAFSTLGLLHVLLEFDHIAKISVFQQGLLEYSVNNGTTWSVVPGSAYLGTSINHPTGNPPTWNGGSYSDPGGNPYWDPLNNITPTSSWWSHEEYDLSALVVDTINPYTQVKLRWNLKDVNPGMAVTMAGWFLDNVNIIGATCELQPPVITWGTNSRQPIGARYDSIITVRFGASDAGAGLDTAKIYYSINNGPIITALMNESNGAACPGTNTYSYDIFPLSVGDTVKWRVELFDCACPNQTIFPNQAAVDSFATTWIDPAPPIKCGTTTPTSFPYVVSLLPWSENFENPNLWAPGTGTGATGSAHRGTWPLGNPPSGRNWKVDPLPTSSGFAWSVRTGPTATDRTGPPGDASAGGTGVYLYTEASQGGFSPPVEAVPFKTPCVDLPANKCAVLEFSYYMYGSDFNSNPPGLLRVDIDTSTGFNQNQFVPNVSRLIGEQQTNAVEGWRTEMIDLNDYAGTTINFQFQGVRRSASDRQDIAVDNITVFEPDNVDMEMLRFIGPINGLCSYSNAEDIEIVMRSRGCDVQDSIPVGFKVVLNGGTPVYSYDTVTDTLSLGEQLQYIYNPKADLSGYGLFEIYAFVDMPGDNNADNDTIGPLLIEHIQPISNYPYRISFDEPGWVYNGGTINQPGTYGTTDWETLPPAATGDMAWVVGQEVTEDFNTGPRRDFSGEGNYLYTDIRTPGNNNALYSLTRCVDLTNTTTPIMSFWYHMYGSNTDLLRVQVQLDGSTDWTNIAGSTVSTNSGSPLQTHETDAWEYKRIDLTPYVGGLVRLRIWGKSTGLSNKSDIAIDNLLIWDENGQTDVGASAVTSPSPVVNLLTTPSPLKVIVTNYGGSSISNVPVSVQVTRACDPSLTNTVTYTYPGPIPVGESAEVTFPAASQPTYYRGANRIDAWTNLSGDSQTYNDTTFSYVAGVGSIDIPYTNENFDSCGFDVKGWFTQGGLMAWEHGTPSKGAGWNAAFSTPNSWNLANNFDYQNQEEILRVPPLTNFDTISGAVLRFRQRYSFGSSDGGRLEYFNGTWQQFGFSSTQVGTNWYGTGGSGAFGGGEAWTGSSSWVVSEFPVFVWNYSPSPLRFRYIVKTQNSNGGQGWSIDDFNLIVPPQNSVSPIFGDTKEYLAVPNRSATIFSRIRNTGEKTLLSCEARYTISGINYTSPWETFSPAIGAWIKGRAIVDTFATKTPALPPGTYTIEIETRRPVSQFDGLPKDDNRPADDTYSFTLRILDEVDVNGDTAGYCNNFEDPNAVPFVPLHSFNKQLAHDWEEGAPTHPLIDSAYSGTNVWATDLDSNYSQMTESALHTPFFIVQPDTVYKFSFHHKMESEQFHDGGNVEFSFDGGVTWYTLGTLVPSGLWFNTTHVTSLGRLSGGWTGSFDWTYSELNFRVDTAGTVVFRFRFGSDYTIDNAGWAIDDFCFRGTLDQEDTGPISVEEQEAAAIGDLTVFPNPANGYTNLHINSMVSAPANVRITNLVGQVLHTEDMNLSLGQNTLEIDTENWSNGVYLVQTEVEGEVITTKFVVTH